MLEAVGYNLTALAISTTGSLYVGGIGEICVNLEELKLNGDCIWCCENGLSCQFNCSPAPLSQLRSLEVLPPLVHQPQLFEFLLHHAHQLEAIRFGYIRNISSEDFLRGIRNIKHLQYLRTVKLKHMGVTMEMIQLLLPSHTQVKTVCLWECYPIDPLFWTHCNEHTGWTAKKLYHVQEAELWVG